MSTEKIEAALKRLGYSSKESETDVAVAEAFDELVTVRKMCRTFKSIGVGAFRDVDKATDSCRHMDAIAAERIPTPAELQQPKRSRLAECSSGSA